MISFEDVVRPSRMSKGRWKPSPAHETVCLYCPIEALADSGREVTSRDRGQRIKWKNETFDR